MSRRWQDYEIELAVHLITVEGKANKSVALILNCTVGELNYLIYTRGLMKSVRAEMAQRSREKMSENIKVVFGKGLDQVTVEMTLAEARSVHQYLGLRIAQSMSAVSEAAFAVEKAKKE